MATEQRTGTPARGRRDPGRDHLHLYRQDRNADPQPDVRGRALDCRPERRGSARSTGYDPAGTRRPGHARRRRTSPVAAAGHAGRARGDRAGSVEREGPLGSPLGDPMEVPLRSSLTRLQAAHIRRRQSVWRLPGAEVQRLLGRRPGGKCSARQRSCSHGGPAGPDVDGRYLSEEAATHTGPGPGRCAGPAPHSRALTWGELRLALEPGRGVAGPDRPRGSSSSRGRGPRPAASPIVRVVMVTGDIARTASAIATEVGLLRSGGAVVDRGQLGRRLMGWPSCSTLPKGRSWPGLSRPKDPYRPRPAGTGTWSR